MKMTEKLTTTEVASKDIKMTVVVAGALFSLIAAVFMVGWNVRGQTAYIQSVEVQTKTLEKAFTEYKANFAEYKKGRDVEYSETRKCLASLQANEAAQTVLLKSINEKIESHIESHINFTSPK
jgi:hypothetical protein